MKPFDQGWNDALRGLPVRATYRHTLPSVQYERGRHVAAMWLFWLKANGLDDMSKLRAVPYTTARRLMPTDLLNAIAAEERFCSLASETLSVEP